MVATAAVRAMGCLYRRRDNGRTRRARHVSGGRGPKRAGDNFERAVVAYLVANSYPYAERAYGAGRPDDRGDIDGVPGWTLQCKAEQRYDLAGALDAAERQRGDRLHGYAAAILKRRNKPTGAAYVVMSLETFAAIAGESLPRESLHNDKIR